MLFIEARWFTVTSGRSIDLIVVHDMEAPEKGTTAEAVARFFQTLPADRKASAHYNIDNDSIVQCVLDKDVAYHAPGANHNGLGFEHAGFASQTRADWMDAFSLAMLKRSADLAAKKCKQYNIPVVFVDAAGLRAGQRGITTHAAVSAAFGRTNHTDPGVGFPMDLYLSMIRAAMLTRVRFEVFVGKNRIAVSRPTKPGLLREQTRLGGFLAFNVKLLVDKLRAGKQLKIIRRKVA